MTTPTNSPVMNNAAMAGCLGGMASGRQTILSVVDPGDLVQPADFASAVAVAETFAVEEQVALGASFAEEGPSAPGAYFTGLGNSGTTTVAASAEEENAQQSLPAAMMLFAMASFDNQPVPSNANGQITEDYFEAQANGVSAPFVNATFNASATGPYFYTL